MRSDSARKHFGPAGTTAGRHRRRRIRRHRHGRQAQEGRHPHLHRLREVRGARRHLVGQPLPGGRGRRRLASLLVLVQEPRLDTHARQAGRTAGLPRRGAGRLRPAPPLPLQHHRPRCGLGRAHAHLHRQSRERRERAGQHGGQRARAAQLPQVSGLARARRLRGAQVPHLPLGARARPDRQAGGPGRNRFDGEPGRPRDRSAGRPPLPVPTRARVGRPQRRPRLHSRRARRLPEQTATAHHAVEGGLPTREEPDRRSDPPARHQDQRRARATMPVLH